MSEHSLEEIRQLLKQLTPEQREEILISMQEPTIPVFQWNSNLNGYKAALKYIECHGEVGLVELKTHLRQLGYIKDESDKINYGIVYENTGLFLIDQDTKKASLTSVGKNLAALFNEDHSEFTALEMLMLRGLQQQAAGYAYLNIVGQSPGISRDELNSRLVEFYGGKGRYYTGYYTRLFSQIGLIAKKREGRQMTYYLTVPESWTGEAPQIEEDEE